MTDEKGYNKKWPNNVSSMSGKDTEQRNIELFR
jgi:hypothetical protein